jgi:hypothetical protein
MHVFWFFSVVSVVWSVSVHVCFLCFLWNVPGFISCSLVVVFNVSVALFLLLPVDLICSQVCIFNKCSVSVYLVTENSSI